MSFIYAVRKGKAPGLYYDIESYQQQVDGFPGAEGRRFTDEAAARKYLAGEDVVKKGIYAVRRGKVPGIYFTAAECDAQVRGFNGAECQRFSTLEQAKAYMNEASGQKSADETAGRTVRKEVRQSRPRVTRERGDRKEPRHHKFVRTPRDFRGYEKHHPGERSTLVEGGNASPSREAPVMVYTDGGCLVHEDGAGGYAAVICLPNGNKKELSGGVDMTRSDRMELLASVAALRALKSFAKMDARVQVYTDSQYLYQGVTKKIWTTWSADEMKSALNNDLWLELKDLIDGRDITWFWVKGHNGNPMNERCDYLAKAAAKRTVAEKKWVPDFAMQLESAKNRIKELERDNKKLMSDSDRFRLLAEDRLSVKDKDLFHAVYNESITGFVKWKFRRWLTKHRQ